DRVRPLLEKAVEASPQNYRARVALAIFLQAHADLQAAEQQGREAVKIDAGRVDAYSILAQVYATRGQWEDLDRILDAACKEVPDDLQPFYYAATALQAAKRAPDRAGRYLRQYAASEPEGNAPTADEARKRLARDWEHARRGDKILLQEREVKG